MALFASGAVLSGRASSSGGMSAVVPLFSHTVLVCGSYGFF